MSGSATGSIPSAEDSSRAQKWILYAETLVKESDSKLEDGNRKDAIVGYLKAAHIYLTLAKYEDNYSTWQQYIDKAGTCHQKIRTLIEQPKP